MTPRPFGGARLPRPIARAHPRRAAGAVTVVALLATAVGDGAPEGLNWDGPGPALFAALAVLVAVVPGRLALAVSVVVSTLFLYGALTTPESLARLADRTTLPVAFAVLQLLGLVVALVAGVVTLRPVREPAPTRS